jgi:hypothetical protein
MSTLPKRPHVLERRLRFEARHPEVKITTPVKAASRKWEGTFRVRELRSTTIPG